MMVEYKLRLLSDEELQKISMEKKKNGCATADALSAQKILYERQHGGFRRVHGPAEKFWDGSFRVDGANILG